MGWFEPKCPVPDEEKAWVDHRMSWLASQFGIERLRTGTLVLPTEEFFPDPYDGSEEALGAMFRRVCGYMDIDPSRVTLSLFSDPQRINLVPGYSLVRTGPGAAGLYDADGPVTIWVETGQRDSPMIMVAVMAHELSHFHLIGGGRVSPEEDTDHEPLTDLTALFFGLGIFGANSVFQYTQSADSIMYRWAVRGAGYLTHRVYAYALALYAWARGDTSPDWTSHLCVNVRGKFKSGLRYLVKTGDTGFRPQGLAQ